MKKFHKLITGFCLGLLVLLVVAASIDYRALNVTQFSAISTVSIISGAPLTNSFIKDLSGKLSLGATARFLYDAGGTQKSLDWDARVGYDTVNVASVLWSARQLNDALGGASLNWDTRTFTGSGWLFGSITNHVDVSSGAFTSGNVWGYNGLTAKWTNGPPATSSGGTVTSVAQTVPGQFQVTGSPVTGSGTLAVTLTNSTGTSNSPIVLQTNAVVSGLTKNGFTTNKNVAASSLMMVDAKQQETNVVTGTGLLFTGGVLTATNQFRTNVILTANIFGAVTAGNPGLYPVAGDGWTISGWSITAQGTAPTCTIDVWKIANGTALPTVANTIMGTKPALATGNALVSTTLTSWNTAVTKNDIWGVNIDAVSGATNLTFQIFGYR